jgi:hypothetical protein
VEQSLPSLSYALASKLPFLATENPEIFDTGECIDVSVYIDVNLSGVENPKEYLMKEKEIKAIVSGDFILQLGDKLGHNPETHFRQIQGTVDKVGMLFSKSIAMKNGTAEWIIPIEIQKIGSPDVTNIDVSQKYILEDGFLILAKGDLVLNKVDLNNYM